MALPFKKRKLSVPLTVKVDRLAKAVRKNKPDMQQYVASAAYSTNTQGYNEHLFDCIPQDVLDTVDGDFVIEKVEFRAIIDTPGSITRGRVDVIVPQNAGQIASTGLVATSDFTLDKQLKSYASKPLYPSSSSPYFICQGQARLGLVAKRLGNEIQRNNPYVLLRYTTSGTGTVIPKVFIRVTYREK